MAVNALDKWQESFDNLPMVGDPSWALNIAGWYVKQSIKASTDPSTLNTDAGFIFVVNPIVFSTGLLTMAPVPVPQLGALGLATAWMNTMLAMMTPAGLFVSPGAYIGAPTPTTTFASVISVIYDPASLMKGFNTILALGTEPPADKSKIPEKLREATLGLELIVVGTDTATSAPLTATGVKLL